MNVIDWLNETARYMVSKHPHLYVGHEEAVQVLSQSLSDLRDTGWDDATLVIGPYIMYRTEQDGVEEVYLSMAITSLALFADEGVCRAYGWHDGINLDDPLDESLDL